MNEKTISSAMEDYLKAIFELGEKDVSTQDLANHLSVSAASVTGMIKKLSDLKLIDYKPYYGVNLTKSGRLIALETIRHHRLIETYLTQALGYKWHEVHDEAEKLEHHISEDFEDRIAEMLGHPTHDPHGDPIPQRDGSIPEVLGKTLDEFEVGQVIKITRIANQQPDVLKYLADNQLMPGATIKLLAKAPFDGPVTLKAKAGELAIALELAHNIYGTKGK